VSVDGIKCGVPFDGVKPCEEKEVTCDVVGRKVKIEILGKPGEDDENEKILHIDTLQAFGMADCQGDLDPLWELKKAWDNAKRLQATARKIKHV
jgi:hypothetical protein